MACTSTFAAQASCHGKGSIGRIGSIGSIGAIGPTGSTEEFPGVPRRGAEGGDAAPDELPLDGGGRITAPGTSPLSGPYLKLSTTPPMCITSLVVLSITTD